MGRLDDPQVRRVQEWNEDRGEPGEWRELERRRVTTYQWLINEYTHDRIRWTRQPFWLFVDGFAVCYLCRAGATHIANGQRYCSVHVPDTLIEAEFPDGIRSKELQEYLASNLMQHAIDERSLVRDEDDRDDYVYPVVKEQGLELISGDRVEHELTVTIEQSGRMIDLLLDFERPRGRPRKTH